MNFKEALKKEADHFNNNIVEGVINLIDGEMARAAEQGKYYINYPLTHIAEEDQIVKNYKEQGYEIESIRRLIEASYLTELFLSIKRENNLFMIGDVKPNSSVLYLRRPSSVPEVILPH